MSECSTTGTHFHRHKHYGPYAKSATIVFRYHDEFAYSLYERPTDEIPASVFTSETNSVFKIPAGFTAIVEIQQVSVSDDKPGRYLFNCTLHPADFVENMTSVGTESVDGLNDPPTSGVCSFTGGNCGGQSNGNCGMSQHPVCEDDLIQCEDDEN